ncbi:hypothetical protein [Streptomyces sp. NPDC088733]|uniref:hypothetical protein n=1 Tax=Streptomyces sp. NPDC088733 TaxID=3365880 RepID=UPI00382DFB85
MTYDNDRNERLEVTEDELTAGFAAIMDDLDSLTEQETDAVRQRAEHALLGHDAYLLGLELLDRNDLPAAQRWLRTAARYQVPGAQDVLAAADARAGDFRRRAVDISSHKVVPSQTLIAFPTPACGDSAQHSQPAEPDVLAGVTAAARTRQIRAAARQEAEAIVSRAREEAAEVITTSRREADTILTEAHREADTILVQARKGADAVSTAKPEDSSGTGRVDLMHSGGKTFSLYMHTVRRDRLDWLSSPYTNLPREACSPREISSLPAMPLELLRCKHHSPDTEDLKRSLDSRAGSFIYTFDLEPLPARMQSHSGEDGAIWREARADGCVIVFSLGSPREVLEALGKRTEAPAAPSQTPRGRK